MAAPGALLCGPLPPTVGAGLTTKDRMKDPTFRYCRRMDKQVREEMLRYIGCQHIPLENVKGATRNAGVPGGPRSPPAGAPPRAVRWGGATAALSPQRKCTE